MGPLLFLVYVNDITGLLHSCEISTYADDTAIFSTRKNMLIAHEEVQSDLHRLSQWCKLNKLTLNPKKTVAMKFGTKNVLKQALVPDLTIDNTVITMSKDFKYLGVVLDERLY